MGSESNMISVLKRDAETDIHKHTHTHTQSYLMMETEARVMAFTSEGMPRFVCNHSKLTEARKDALLSNSEGF